ncbi:unnamed protein product [Owenia fusiformis]|uniref:Uncharacterized protein n=1 Tax=Owenia fusiformis TaxID=6347 RepID=A0A8S4QBE9_OWEFU|nr:unnamed protein product [Owenia fusiformis]
MAGLLDGVIWVWPQWDAVNHDTVYRQWIVELGTTEVKIDGYLTKVFCICHLEGNDTEFDCRYLNEEDANDVGYMGTKIDKDKCKRPTKRGIFEELQEDNALEKLKGGHWFKDNENIILDIDEDYFGCESGTDSLINAKIPWKLVEEINKLLNELICIKITEHEKLADRLLYNHINSFKSLCSRTGKCDLTKALKLLEDEVAKLPRQILCHGRNKQMVKQICLMINNKIARLSKTQMNTLQETGFCAQTTVKSFTHLLENENGFKVCHGVNAPNQSVVIFHSPTIEETNTRITLLGDLLGDKHLPKPKLVTLCRSMRDGYTPKSQYHKIEKGIIDSVINSHKNSFAVYYDKDLLGGQKGWPGRHTGK